MRIKKDIRNFNERYLRPNTYFLFTLIYIPLIAVFFTLERVLVPRYTVYIWIDDYIPYIPEFVVFYFVWFIYMFVFTAYFMFNSKRDFIRMTLFIAIGMVASFIMYAIFPNEQPLRPTNTGGGIFGQIVMWLHAIDTPTNVCPSIHVINSMGVYYTTQASDAPLFGYPRLVKEISFWTAVMIMLSTMFIKQHSIIDVICGIILAVCINFLMGLPCIRAFSEK